MQASGFGVAFLGNHAAMNTQVAVKTLGHMLKLFFLNSYPG